MITLFQLLINGLLIGGVYGLFACTVVVIYKATSVVSFAHGQIVTFMAFVCVTVATSWGLPLPVAFLVTFIIAALTGMIVERVLMRPLLGKPELSSVMMTIALWSVLSALIVIIWKGHFYEFPQFIPSEPIYIGDIQISGIYLWGFIIALGLVGFFSILFAFTKQGLNMRATAENSKAAEAAGINVTSVFSQAWMVSMVITAMSAILLAADFGVSGALGDIFLKGLTVILLGGLNSFPGAIVGGLLVGLAENMGSGYLDPLVGGGFRDVAPLILILLILYIRPKGLFGMEKIRRL